MKVARTRAPVNVAAALWARDHARMPRISRVPLALAVVALLALAPALVACGGAEADSPTSTGTATATPAPGTASPGTAGPASQPTPSEPVASTYFVPTEDLPVVRFTTAEGGTVDLPVEVPPTSEYGIGLSGRDALEGRGMVFYYPDESGGPGFWMRNTHIDLDIAFVGGDLRIIMIRQMQAESEEVHHPDRAYLAGIEAPAGWYAEHGIAEGDRVELLFDVEDYLE